MLHRTKIHSSVFLFLSCGLLLGCVEEKSRSESDTNPDPLPSLSANRYTSQSPDTTSTRAKTSQPTKQNSNAGKKTTRQPDVIFVPTPQDVVEKMLEVAGVRKKDVVYDLGCGDGRIVVTAAKKYGCKAIGFDIDPKRITESKENVSRNKVGDLVQIKNQDIFKLDLSKANVLTLYLLPSLNVRLIPQIEKMKAGSRIVSHSFDMKGVKPDKVIHIKSKQDGRQHTIYFWTVPLKKEKKSPR